MDDPYSAVHSKSGGHIGVFYLTDSLALIPPSLLPVWWRSDLRHHSSNPVLKNTSQSVCNMMYPSKFLASLLLLLSGDVETNPGPLPSTLLPV